jgi:predicted HicB family RNase H-like nuclease
MPDTENRTQAPLSGHDLVYQAAHRLYSERPDWVTFFREVLGVHGIVRRTHRSPEALADFQRTQAYGEILQMLTRLREQRSNNEEFQEPTRVITIRLPKSLHEKIRVEAYEHHTSMNKLCISKLLQYIESEMVPKER